MMLGRQNWFSIVQNISALGCCGDNYIKKKLSIEQKVSSCCLGRRKQFILGIPSKREIKMDYLQYFYEKLFGNGDGDCSTTRKIVTFGNVILDTTVHLTDEALFEQFNIVPDSKGELDSETITKITAAACANIDCVKNPGGSALNTSRIIAKLGTEPTFFGAIGEDEAGEELKKLISAQLADARLQRVSDTPSGQCIVLVHNGNSTLYANIGASAKFTIEHLKQEEEQHHFFRPIERKQVFYIEGFFIPHREEVCDYISEHYITERRRLAINLSADYIVKENSQQIKKLAEKALFIFGNQKEFESLMKEMECKTEMDMAQKLTQDGKVAKIIIITRGEKGVTLISNYDGEFEDPGNLSMESFNAQRVESLVDPTGAGDAFVAAFLHYWLQKRQLTECVRLAADTAAKVCSQIGCHLPDEKGG